MEEPKLVFVYGLLMRGQDLHHYMKGGVFAAEGCTKGQLVSLGRYPGFIDGSGTVRGELYRFDDLPAALDVLDDVEEFDATDPVNSIYLRVVRPVMVDGGTEVPAWLYIYNGNTQGVPRIRNGDWRTKILM